MKAFTLLKDFTEVLTLAPAAEKKGRHISTQDLGILKNTSILLRGEKIEWVGPTKNLPTHYTKKIKKVIPCKGFTALPAFIECHTHSLFAGSRSHEFELRQSGMSYLEIAKLGGGIQSTVAATRSSKERELYQSLETRVHTFAKQGVATLEVKTGYGLSLEHEIRFLKILNKSFKITIVPTFLGAHAIPKEFNSAHEYLDHLSRKILPEIKRRRLSKRVDIFIEKSFFEIKESEAYLKTAQKLGFDLSIHAEQLSRTQATALGVKLGAKSVDHCIEIDRGDIQQLASSNTTAVLLPTADLYLKMKYPPARSLLDSGARVALATDFNPGTSPTQDLTLVGLLARLKMKMTLPEVITAYTLNAAYALGLEALKGTLEAGKDADIAILNGPWTDLFYSVGQTPVESLWVQGKPHH